LLIRHAKVAAKEIEVSVQLEDALVEIVVCLDRWEKNVLSHSQAHGVLQTSTLLFTEIIHFLVVARIHYQNGNAGLRGESISETRLD
jgi:hypothetical protein